MAPQKKNKENQNLPHRWRYRFGAYRYRVPKKYLAYWNNQTEFKLGNTLAEAHTTFAQRVSQYTHTGTIQTMAQVIDRYRTEQTPKKSPRTQKDEHKMLDTLRCVFGNQQAKSIEPSHIYKIYDAMRTKRGLTTANRHMELLSNIFTLSIRYGARSDHPMTHKKFTKDTVKRERRYVKDWEIEEALKVAPPLIDGYVRLKWLLGLRQTDMLDLRESQIKDGLIAVRPKKVEKYGNPGLEIVITAEVQKAIDRVRRNRPMDSMFLFCNRNGQSYLKADRTCNGFQSIWGRWMRKALSETALEQRFSERSIRTKVATDIETTAEAQALMGHTTEATTRKHYRQKPNRVMPFRPSHKQNSE